MIPATRDTTPAQATREKLLDTAEALFLDRGLNDVSLRTIVREAGQRNQSALQYHFGGREGLIAAILQRRMQQLEARRSVLVSEALAKDPDPELHEVCAVLARAPFLLCREERSFREVLGLFGQQLLASDHDLLLLLEDRSDLASLNVMRALLRQHLEHLPPEVLRLRVENTYSLSLMAISRRARRGDSFRGRRAELFFNNLVDQVAAMLAAPVSVATGSYLS